MKTAVPRLRPLTGRAFATLTLALAGVLGTGWARDASAGDRWVRYGQPAAPVPTARFVNQQPGPAVNNYGRLGSFYPTPYITVRGNAPVGGGYSPLGMYGDVSMSVYGPLSSFRQISAPVLAYSRGYDGRTVLRPATSFSNPNLPALTPVVYPTQATNYYGFRQSGTPPWWPSAINWIDQN